MNLTKKVFIPLASTISIGATIACPIALVSCGNNHITINKDAKSQTIDGFLAYYPMTLNTPWSENENIKVELASEPDVNWQFSLDIRPMNDAANIQMFLTLSQGIHGEAHDFDAKFTVYKLSGGATVWTQTITGFKVIYN